MDTLLLLCGLLAATLGYAAFMSLRNGNERRDTALMLAAGIGFGMIALNGAL